MKTFLICLVIFLCGFLAGWRAAKWYLADVWTGVLKARNDLKGARGKL